MAPDSFTNGDKCLSMRWAGRILSLRLLRVDEAGESAFLLRHVRQDDACLAVIWHHPVWGEVAQTWYWQVADGAVAAVIAWRLRSCTDDSALIRLEASCPGASQSRFMIPGALYRTNGSATSRSLQPQFEYGAAECYPVSSALGFRADRSTHNCVLAAYCGDVLCLGIDERVGHYHNGLWLSAPQTPASMSIGVSLGYRHYPKHYRGKLGSASVIDGAHNGISLKSFGGRATCTSHLFWGPSPVERAYQAPLKWLYTQVHQAPESPNSRQQTIADLVEGLLTDAWNQSERGFPTVVGHPDANCDLAWTGGMQVVYPLLRAGKRHPETLPIAIAYIEHVFESGINESSGLFFETCGNGHWHNRGWWQAHIRCQDAHGRPVTEPHSAYINGQAICYLLKSIQWLEEQGLHGDLPLSRWLGVIDRQLALVVREQRQDGAYGVFYSPFDGSALSYEGFQGAWMFAALSERFAMNRSVQLLASLQVADEYYARVLDSWEPAGTPMDIEGAVDEEGNLAYITALKTLHRVTREHHWLRQLTHAFHFEFTWKFAYNTLMTHEPLRSIAWSSCGGSVTSCHNVHIHPMGNLVAEELYYLVRETEDAYFESRLRDTVVWGLGCHNSAHRDFGFGARGHITEQFFHSDAVQDDPARVEDGGIWPAYLPWAAGCVLLSSVADIPDKYFK